MRVGVICEFNPIHNGHIYLFERVREHFGDCAVICIMSGAFTQRGIPALYPKYDRARAALMCGANAVYELPFPYCSAPAPYFARAGVEIASRVGCDALAFGSESGDLDLLCNSASRLCDAEFKAFAAKKREDDRATGVSHILSLNAAYSEYWNEALPTGANNTLALEYIKAVRELAPEMELYTVKRDGIASASAARYDVLTFGSSRNIPQAACEVFADSKRTDYAKFDLISFSFMREHAPRELARFADSGGGFAERLFRLAGRCATPEEFFASAADKKHTTSRVRRFILGCMCAVTPKMWEAPPTYTVLLAFDRKGRPLPKKSDDGFYVVTKPASYRALPQEVVKMYEKGLYAESYFGICAAIPADESLRHSPFVGNT